MHKLLGRQLKKHFGSLDAVPEHLAPLLQLVDEAYLQADHDRTLLERSLDLTSDELLAANARLRADIAKLEEAERQLQQARDELEKRVTERTAELVAVNASLEREIAERKAAEWAIRQSEEKYRSLFEESRDVIYISAPDGRLLDINRAGMELFGFESKEEFLCYDVTEFYFRPEERGDFVRTMIEQGYVKDVELELKRRDGRRLTVLETAVAVRDEAGEVAAFRGILRNVTGQKELERQLRQSQKLEAVGRLAGGVAHDFNNLLTAILGYSDLLAMTLPSGTQPRSQVAEIRRAANRGADLTRQLLALSRRQVLRPKVFRLDQVVADMEKLLRRLLSEDIELATDLEAGSWAVRADPSQIEQVVLNLVLNARDAMPEGGRLTLTTRNLDLSARSASRPPGLAPGAYVQLVVTDTGVGMDEATQERIFEPFFTTKDGGEGTGLGLATVYGIVEQSGGHIEVESAPRRGSTFRVYLPRVEAEPDFDPATHAEAASVRGHGTVLLVEDEPAVRTFLADFLDLQGYRVHSVGDGLEALSYAEDGGQAIDLLLTDVVMPRMGGVELAQRLKTRQPGLKVLMISGHTERPEILPLSQGPRPDVAFLQKPFTTADLVRKLRDLLEPAAAT